MTRTGHTPIDEAPQVVAEWTNRLCDDLGWGNKERAYRLLSETLHALRDYLNVNEAADLAAQLPLILRGIYYTGWKPSATPAQARNKEDFLNRVARAFSTEPLEDEERAVAAVFDLLRAKISMGEIDHVSHAMRAPLQELWH